MQATGGYCAEPSWGVLLFQKRLALLLLVVRLRYTEEPTLGECGHLFKPLLYAWTPTTFEDELVELLLKSFSFQTEHRASQSWPWQQWWM